MGGRGKQDFSDKRAAIEKWGRFPWMTANIDNNCLYADLQEWVTNLNEDDKAEKEEETAETFLRLKCEQDRLELQQHAQKDAEKQCVVKKQVKKDYIMNE